MFFIVIIEICLTVYALVLDRKVKDQPTFKKNLLFFFVGLATFFFAPISFTLFYRGQDTPAGLIQIFSEIVGAYAVIRSLSYLIKSYRRGDKARKP